MTLQDCPFWSLLLRKAEPEQRFYSHAVARLEAHNVNLELVTKDNTLYDEIELRPAQILSRLVKVFQVLETKPSDNSASIEMFKHIVRPLVQMDDGPFSLDQRVDLVGSALPTLTLHLTTDLRDVATLLLSEGKLFEKLLASEKHAPVLQRWLSSRQHQQLLGQSLLENLTEKSISLGENCSGDHGISRECEEWRLVQELMHATNEIITSTRTENGDPASQTQAKLIPLSKMKVLGEDDKKTHQARQEKKKSYKLPASVEDGLIKLDILLPQGSNGLRQTREQLQGKASQLICAAVNSFPCRFCSERLAGDMITSKVTIQSPNAYPATSNDAQVNLYGERLGAWKILLSELAMAKARKLIESGMLPNIERTLRELAQGNWKKSRRVPQGSDPSLVPVTPVRGTPLTAEKDYFILWQIDAGYYDELTKRKQFGQIIKGSVWIYT